ncbi:MAG: hypothetical protein ACTSYA_03365 [Candidatus Kariarchaeaceae archaeon]
MESFKDPLVIVDDPSPRYSPRIKVRMSFDTALEFSIVEFIETSERGFVTQEELFNYFGHYSQTKKKVKNLCLSNILHKEIIISKGRTKRILLRKTNRNLSQWNTLNACPCFTCSTHEECSVNNPVSPVKCAAFNAWIASDMPDGHPSTDFLLNKEKIKVETSETEEQEEEVAETAQK